jgi:hypothetical protein
VSSGQDMIVHTQYFYIPLKPHQNRMRINYIWYCIYLILHINVLTLQTWRTRRGHSTRSTSDPPGTQIGAADTTATTHRLHTGSTNRWGLKIWRLICTMYIVYITLDICNVHCAVDCHGPQEPGYTKIWIRHDHMFGVDIYIQTVYYVLFRHFSISKYYI